ncbi:MAG: hypothetical protein K1X94_30145 [Sandaracinaceae bacterium]|nr:hypothetical protein [Sandaracinaceae bacterium]
MRFPELSFATPRKLPRAIELRGRVVVLDIAFAAEGTGTSFEKVTKKLIDGLGTRLALWVDHHDHVLQAEFNKDPRFVLATKAQHGACPEMITPSLVERAGPVDTILCHGDFDGLCAAAKWIRGGLEAYEGADRDAHAVDTRLGAPSERGLTIDRALRARPRDDGLKGLVVRFLATGATEVSLYRTIQEAAEEVRVIEEQARELARRFVVENDVAVCDARGSKPYDKTVLLLLGQERARISVVHDDVTVTAAARFDSGVDLLTLFGVEGGMPTRVSLPAARLAEALAKLGYRA